MANIAEPWTAWPVVGAAAILIACDLASLCRCPLSPKRYLRLFGAMVGAWLLMMYTVLGLDLPEAGELTAEIRRMAILILIALLAAETIADCKRAYER